MNADPLVLSCAHVIEFTPTSQWFSNSVEAVADDEARRDIYRFGGATDLRTVPDFDRWSRPVESPCAANANAPGRVVSSISGDFPDDPSWWVGPIGTVLDLIRDKYPRTSLIVLEPVCRRARSRGVPDEPRPCIPESARD